MKGRMNHERDYTNLEIALVKKMEESCQDYLEMQTNIPMNPLTNSKTVHIECATWSRNGQRRSLSTSPCAQIQGNRN